MSSYNKVILCGHVGQKPQCGYTQNQKMFARFSVATNEHWKDANGEKQERTDWFNISCWGRTAEIVEQYVAKGKGVLVEGKIQNQQWEDENGYRHNGFQVLAASVVLLGAKAQGTEDVSDVRSVVETATNKATVKDDLPF